MTGKKDIPVSGNKGAAFVKVMIKLKSYGDGKLAKLFIDTLEEGKQI